MADDYLSTDPNAGDAVAQPQAAAGYLSTDPNTGAAPGDHQALVRQSLLDHGVKPVAAAAILGDIKQESSFNPHEVTDNGTSFGLLQVGGPMFRQFNADQAAQGIHPGDPEYTYNQAPYVLDRFKQQHPDRWDAMQNADSAPQALQIFRGTKDWGYGIAGKRYQYAQDYEQQLSGVPVQQQDTYTRVEKAVPVQEVEHPVARAYPVNGPRPPLPGGPDTLNAPPVPAGYLSIDPNAGDPVATGTPASIAAPEGNFPLATAVVPPGLINYGNQQVAPTPSGKLPAQPPPDIFASPEAYGQSVSTGQDYTPAEAERANKIWQTRLVNLPRVKAGDISASGQPLSSFDAATVNMARGFASGLTSMEGLFGLIPPVGLAELAANSPHLIDQVHAAEQTPAWSQDRWEAGLNVITSLAGAGVLGEATIKAGIAGIPETAPKPGMELGPAAPAAAGEAGAAPPTGETGAPPTGEAGAAAPGAAAAPPRTWANVAEELRWLAKNDPAQFKVRFAEEMAKRRQGEYNVNTSTEPVNGAAPEPAPAQPTAAAPEPAPETPAPTAAAPAPAPEAEAPAVSQPGGPIIPTAITDELAARGHSPAQIAALSAGQAANLVLQPAPDEIAAGTAGPPTLAPAQPGEQPGSAWHGVPFLSQDRVKAELAGIGFQPDQIDNMTRSQLDAATPALQAARQQPAAAAAAAPTPAAPEAAPAAPAAAAVQIRKAVDRYDFEEQHAGASDLANDLEQIQNLPQPLAKALQEYRDAEEEDRTEWGERSGLPSTYGDRLYQLATQFATPEAPGAAAAPAARPPVTPEQHATAKQIYDTALQPFEESEQGPTHTKQFVSALSQIPNLPAEVQQALDTYKKRPTEDNLDALFSKAGAAVDAAEPAGEDKSWLENAPKVANFEDLPKMPPGTVTPPPRRKWFASGQAAKKGELLSQSKADQRIADWKAQAKRIGQTEDHSNEVIISLFDRTGQWSQPWEDAGYRVLRYDIANGDDLLRFFPSGDIIKLREAGFKVKGVLAAPPCTSFAVSGARWWATQHDKASLEMLEKKYGDWAPRYFDTPLEYAQTLVHAAEAVVEMAHPEFHAIENPVGRIAKVAGLPDPLLTFDPKEYGAPYTKKTQLWGNFNPELPLAPVKPTKGSWMHTLRGDVTEEKLQRSVTPEGFAYSFFLANHGPLDPARYVKLGAPKPQEMGAPKAKPFTEEQRIAQDEARKEMEAQGQEAIAAQGGMDLIEAVTHEGGLPLKGSEGAHHYRGELKMLRETIRGTKGVRYKDIFSSKSAGVDPLVLRLRARGFDFHTPDDLLQALEHRLRTGIPHYGLPEAGQARHGQPRVGEEAVRPLRLGEAPNSGNLHPDPQRASLKQIADDDPGVIEATKRVLDANSHTRRLRDALLNDGRVVRRGRKIFILNKGGQAVGQVDNATGGLSEFVDVPTGRLEKGETPERGFQQRQDKIEQYAGLTTRPPLIAAHGPRFPGDTYEIINGHHRYEAALLKGTPSLRTDASIVNGTGTWISIPRAGQEGGIPDYAARLQNTIAAMQPPTPAPYGEGNPVPAANTAKLAEDIQTFLDFNKVPPARKAQATEEIKNTLALAGDPALQAFYEGGFYGVPGQLKAAALRANKNRLSIIYHDLISHAIPTWNIEGSIIANPADFAMAVQPIRSPYFESFKVVARDPITKRVLATEITSVGTLDEAIVHPRDVFRLAAKYPNAEFIVSHNHPSGKPKPSDPDRSVQAKLHEAAAAVGVKLADHVITNGHDYFSFEQEELTGDGYGKLPNPVNQPWEVVRQEESPKITSPDDLANFTVSLRADDPNATHIFYTGTQGNLKAIERVTNGTNLPAIKQAIANGIAREGAYGVLVDFGNQPPQYFTTIAALANMVHDAMAAKFLDASWPGMDSARASGVPGLRRLAPGVMVAEQPYGRASEIPGPESSVGAGATGGPGSGAAIPRLSPLSQMERTTLETLRRAKGTLTGAGKRKLARLEARLITQGDLLAGQNDVFNLQGEEVTDWAARQAQADAAEAVRVAAQQAAEKAQMSLFEKPSMPYVTGTARVNESTGGGAPPYGPQGASMFSGNTPPRSNPMPVWAKRYANKMRAWWQDMLPRSYEIVRKVPESPVISEHQKLMERELAYVQNFTAQPWWQALRRRPEEEIVDLEHQAVMTYRRLMQQGTPRDAAWAQAVAQAPPDLQALFQYREGRVPTERWAAGQLAVDEPAYTGDPYIARLTNEEGKAVVDLHPQIANWGRHIRQSIGSFDKSRVHATMKEGIQNGVQYEPPTMAAFVRELYSARLEGTARMLKRLKDEGVLFDDKAAAIAAGRTLPKSAGPVTLVRGFGGKDYWARSRVEAQFLAQNLNTTNSAGAVGKLVRVANAFARNPNLLYNPLPHLTKNMAFKYALNRIGNFGLSQSARQFGTNAQMRARFEAVMPMPTTGARLPQLRALEAGSYLERMLAKGGKWLSGNHFSARFNFAKADPALRYALWKTYLKKGMSDQAAANHVWVDLVRYDENSGALNFWRGIPLNFFATWRLGSYISLVKAMRSHPIRALLFIGAVEYLRAAAPPAPRPTPRA